MKMPKFLRIFLSGLSFFIFFCGSPILAFVVFPMMRLFVPKEQFRERTMRILQRGCAGLCIWFRRFGLIDFQPIGLPAGLDTQRPYVLIANHPSLVDTVLLMGFFPGMTCVAKSSWYHSFTLGALLRSTDYICGPDKDEGGDVAFQRFVTQLGKRPLLVFPEGTRSLPDRLNRFRLGAFAAAVEARVPIAALFIRVDRAMLLKGQPWYSVPDNRGLFEFEWIEVVDTEQERDAKQIRGRLEARYRELYQEVLAKRAIDAVQDSA